ncbi:FAD/NAD(P)-binding domain-containing protein [Mycena galericulata]|nr:FAD/NAD(P)-binding domain-containing protein [Mycena galericulata]
MATASESTHPLSIAIVGAGIGGLAAATALRRNGHLVHVFEAVESKTELAFGLGVQLNALRVLEHFGVIRENLKGIPANGVPVHAFLVQRESHWVQIVMLSSEGGEGKSMPFTVPTNGVYCHRSDLYEELVRLATGEGEGPPAQLRLGHKVVGCDPEAGTITLQTGEVVHADFVVGADGVNSVVRTHILGHVQAAPESGWSCLRIVLEAPTNLHEMPELEWFHEGVTGVRVIMAKEGPFRRWIVYPIRNGTLINTVLFYTDSPEDEARSRPIATKEEVLDKFSDFDTKLLRILDLPAHGPFRRWKLRVLPELPTWIRGRAALLGDAAHATFPFFAQGAGMAIEEAAALGFLLPSGTRREDVPARLQAYQDLRKERGDFVRKGSVEQVTKFTYGGSRSKDVEYLIEYDAIKASQEFYQERFGKGSISK